jgi:hypothetical protein
MMTSLTYSQEGERAFALGSACQGAQQTNQNTQRTKTTALNDIYDGARTANFKESLT